MRRGAIVAVVVLLTLPVWLPGLAAEGLAQVPQCCRRDGQHHCAMSQGDSTDNVALRAPACPHGSNFLKLARTLQLHPHTTARAGLILTAQDAPLQPAAVNAHSSAGRSHHKRGPPFSIAG